jgi:DNA helicase-2/ATP-dependent DNA helicase PcrA
VNREDLTPRQLEVVETRAAVVLVLGGPGTGKTTTALWTAREALERHGVEPWQRVLFLTFSRTAVAQVAKRAPGVFASAGAGIEIATFHGFAWRLVRAFGRYAGHGPHAPELQSAARTKLLGKDAGQLAYDDLVPAARALLTSDRLAAILARRWPLVVCDEFQDTDNEQWALLTMLGRHSRLLLLADPNQMIYTFLRDRGVSPTRLANGRRLAGRVIELETASHRDPSGVIPAMAEAVRQRRFGDAAVLGAIRTSRLFVLRDVPDDLEALARIIQSQVGRLRAAGARAIGIFGHSNDGVATLGAALESIGLDHVLVGIPEAHAEALVALATLCAYSVGTRTLGEVRVALAAFLTACVRRAEPPPLAVRLANGSPLPPGLEPRLHALGEALRAAQEGRVADLIGVAGQAWEGLGITVGNRPWRRACADFAALARPFAASSVSREAAEGLLAAAERRRPSVIVDFDATKLGPIQLMNFYQTKGREADAVILAYRSGDYLADRREGEPFEESSRVLFVSLTRARYYVVVILPPDPHPLVAPFAALV